MSLVTCPCRNSFASPPVARACRARSGPRAPQPVDQRAVRLARGCRAASPLRFIVEPRRCAAAAAPPRAGAPRRPPARGTPAASAPRTTAASSSPPEPLEQRRAGRRCPARGRARAGPRGRGKAAARPCTRLRATSWRLHRPSRRSSTRCRPTGRTWSSTCACRRAATSTPIVLLVQVNPQPYSHHDWHWRLLVAHQFGHAAAAPAVHGTLRLLDEAGSRASSSCASCAAAGWRTPTCGAAPSPCARSSAGSARSSGPRRRRLRRPAARLQRARHAARGGARGAAGRRRRGRRRPPAPTCWSSTSARRASTAWRWSSGCARAGELGATRTLGVYSHVHHDVKLRAEGAGFDLVVPRSRMAREGAALVERLA